MKVKNVGQRMLIVVEGVIRPLATLDISERSFQQLKSSFPNEIALIEEALPEVVVQEVKNKKKR